MNEELLLEEVLLGVIDGFEQEVPSVDPGFGDVAEVLPDDHGLRSEPDRSDDPEVF
jgi:hypothetical protein